jgi:serine/threonine protein kinase
MAELTTTRLAQLRAAVTAWRKLDNPADEEAARFPRLHEVLASPTRLHVVCEISGPPGCCPVDLHTLIEQRGRLAEADARQIYARLVLAVKAAHDVGIALRSIKPETIQVWQPPAGGWEVALCDLFCAATVDETEEDGNSLRGLCGTPEFCAPEVVLFFWADRMSQPPPAYGPMADIWALGICLHVMLCGCLPFDTSQPEEDMLREINGANFDFDDPGWAKISSDGRELVKTLLARDARDRLTVYGVLQHPFCAEDVNLAINTSRVSRLQSADFDQALNLLDDDE